MAIPKSKLTATIKKKVKHDWQQQIPSLTAGPEAQRFYLSRLVGPLMIGIAFDTKSFNNHYYPGFSSQTLFDVRDHLGKTLSKRLMKTRINVAGETITSAVSISVECHEKDEYIEATRLMQEQALLPLAGPVSISMIWQAYQKYYVEAPAYFNMSIVEDPALIAAWAGRDDIAQQALDWGYETYKEWCGALQQPDPKHDPEVWLETMKKRIADPETLRRNTVEMIAKHKLDYLPQEELILE